MTDTPRLWLPEPGERIQVTVDSKGSVYFNQPLSMSLQPLTTTPAGFGGKDPKEDE